MRAYFGLRQQALAALLGTTQQRLHTAEAGTRDPSSGADLRLRPLLPLPALARQRAY